MVKHVLLEVFIVVTGILLAFNVEFNVEQYFKNKKEDYATYECLKELKKEIKNNREDKLKTNINSHTEQVWAVDSIINILKARRRSDNLFSLVKGEFQPLIFAPITGAYDDLKLHHIGTIRSKKLIILLRELYEYRFVSLIKFEEEYVPSQFYQSANEILQSEFLYEYTCDSITKRSYVLPRIRDINSLAQNGKLALLLHRAKKNRENLNKIYINVENLMNETLQELDRELLNYTPK